MRVLIYCYFAPLAHHLTGGAQRFLDGLIHALPGRSLKLTIICPPCQNNEYVSLASGFEIIDKLLAVDKEASPAEMNHDLELLELHASMADVIITVDRHFPVTTGTPIILCLNNFSYGPETRAAFGLNWDAIVTPSAYLRRCLNWYFGKHIWTGDKRPIHVIPCSISNYQKRKAEPLKLANELQLSSSERYLAFPHRPDPNKGFETAVEAVAELRARNEEYVLLVPTPIASEIWPHQRQYLKQRLRFVQKHGLENAVRFHRWIRADEMTAYLRLSEYSLCLSQLPEGFGLCVIEGLVAGIPVITTPAGAIRELIPKNHGVFFVDFDDPRMVAEAIMRDCEQSEVALGQRFVHSRYNSNLSASLWIEVMMSVKKSESNARFSRAKADNDTQAPWFYELSAGQVWHDYEKKYVKKS